MRIPTKADDHLAFLRELLDKLFVSRQAMQSRTKAWRAEYLTGGYGEPARFNVIYPRINTLASYLYSQRTARFTFDFGPASDQSELDYAEAAASHLRDQWLSSGADTLASEAVRWALVDGAAFIKWTFYGTQPRANLVRACDVSVWREDLTSVLAQPVFLHCYDLDPSALCAWLVNDGMPEADARERVSALIVEGSEDAEDAGSGTITVGMLNPITTSPPAGVYAGAVDNIGPAATRFSPGLRVPVVPMQELWVWDDSASDWRTVTLANEKLVVSDTPNTFVPGMLPFACICPSPTVGYFWGYSEVAPLVPLQAWREKRFNQLDRLLMRQVNPPMVFSGFMGGVQDEKAATVMRRGGVLANSQTPGAKVEMLYPQMPPETFGEIQQIDAMMDATIGLSATLQGAAESGVRGGEHAAQLMQAGSSRVLARALNIESGLREAAQLLYAALRRYDPAILVGANNLRFTLGQLPESIRVEVAAHSASPLFAQALKQDALQMLELGIIDGSDYIDLADPPFAETLKRRFEERENQKKQMEQAELKQLPPKDRAGLLAAILGSRRARK